MTHTEACIALNMVPKLGPVRIRALRRALGSAEEILRTPADRLAGVDGVGRELARTISRWEDHVDLGAELARIQEAGVHVLTAEDEHYPRLLREIHDPPTALYVWGELTERDHHGIGIVGSRQASMYAAECAKKFGYQLAYAGLTVYSGLARGIDTNAHLGALAAKGRTVAVMGGGLSEIYPPDNFDLAQRIADGRGALISEFSMSVVPDRQTFPMRNRLISGACHGVLVVEAGERSGALHSATFAADQGRTVFAIPGQIDKPNAIGSNRLIQQGAKLVMDGGDILDELSDLFRPSARSAGPDVAATAPAGSLTEPESALLGALAADECGIDELIGRTRLPAATVTSTLFSLELKRLVRQLPGKRYAAGRRSE
ncbi:MAG: DNA-protecting protein DprA [Verrucomicrobia bacterium]|nr:DNA-protecting protein DprA [Verrucomicrobiota bacterium]